MKLIHLATIVGLSLGLSGCQSSIAPRPQLSDEQAAAGVPPNAGSQAPTLYVLNVNAQQASVSVYADGGKKFLRSISLGQYDNFGDFVGFATDKRGYFYGSASTSNPSPLKVYANRGAKLIHTISQRYRFSGLTFDSADNLYTTCANARVCEYGTRTYHTKRKLSSSLPPMAADTNGNVAMLNPHGDFPWVYAPGQKQPYWEVTSGTDYTADAMLFDANGSLYVSMRGDSSVGSVAVFAPKATSPTYVITDVIYPEGIAIDASGNLYVLNQCSSIQRNGQCASPGNVAVYAPGSQTPSRVISQGIIGGDVGGLSDDGLPLAVDANGTLYVANTGTNVTVYAPGASSPSFTITKGITNPTSVAIGR